MSRSTYGLILCIILDFDADEQKQEDDNIGRPAWMIHVQHTTDTWLKSLPKVKP